MNDYVKRLRAPALLAVLGVIAVLAAVSVGYFAVLVSGGQSPALGAQMAGSASPSLLWFFAAVALALTCLLLPPTPAGVSRLVSAAALVAGAATAISLGFWVIGLFGGLSLGVTLGSLGGLIETAFKAACAVILWRLRHLSIEAEEQAVAGQPVKPVADGADSGQPPVWNPDQAVGLQWNRAGDAATGARAPATIPPGPPPEPERRQLWSRGGVPPERLQPQPPELPWTTAGGAADGQAAGPASLPAAPDDRPGRQTPDWTPAPRPERH